MVVRILLGRRLLLRIVRVQFVDDLVSLLIRKRFELRFHTLEIFTPKLAIPIGILLTPTADILRRRDSPFFPPILFGLEVSPCSCYPAGWMSGRLYPRRTLYRQFSAYRAWYPIDSRRPTLLAHAPSVMVDE